MSSLHAELSWSTASDGFTFTVQSPQRYQSSPLTLLNEMSSFFLIINSSFKFISLLLYIIILLLGLDHSENDKKNNYLDNNRPILAQNVVLISVKGNLANCEVAYIYNVQIINDRTTVNFGYCVIECITQWIL